MKIIKIIIALSFILGSLGGLSAQSNPSVSCVNDSMFSYITALIEDIDMGIYKEQNKSRYKLYPTENIYNLLKLDTQTGRIEQVQWSLDTSKEFSRTINKEDLSWNAGAGAFELYPTQNMYQFILLDKTNGRTWHVQWGLEDKKRWIRRIY